MIENDAPIPGLEQFVNEFYQDRVLEFNEMQEFRKEKRFEDIRKLAHKWKGFCAPYGFQGLESLSTELEVECKSSNVEKIDELISKISKYMIEKGKIIK